MTPHEEAARAIVALADQKFPSCQTRGAKWDDKVVVPPDSGLIDGRDALRKIAAGG